MQLVCVCNQKQLDTPAICQTGDRRKPQVTTINCTIGTVPGHWSEPSSLPRHCCPWSGQVVTVRRAGTSPQYHNTPDRHYTLQYSTDVMLLGVAGVLQLLTFALVQIIGKFKTRIQGEKKMISPFHCIEAPSCHDIYP